jgi:hypothetical protein
VLDVYSPGNNPRLPNGLPVPVLAPAGVGAVVVFAFPAPPNALPPVGKMLFPGVAEGAPPPPGVLPAAAPPNAALVVVFAPKFPKRPPVAGVDPGAGML